MRGISVIRFNRSVRQRVNLFIHRSKNYIQRINVKCVHRICVTRKANVSRTERESGMLHRHQRARMTLSTRASVRQTGMIDVSIRRWWVSMLLTSDGRLVNRLLQLTTELIVGVQGECATDPPASSSSSSSHGRSKIRDDETSTSVPCRVVRPPSPPLLSWDAVRRLASSRRLCPQL